MAAKKEVDGPPPYETCNHCDPEVGWLCPSCGLSLYAGDLARQVLATLAARERQEKDEPPKWYTEDEIYHWLKLQNYSDQIAKELALLIANNHQLAFNKGWQMGKAERERQEADDAEPIDCPWLCSLGFKFVPGTTETACGGWVLCLVDFEIDEERGIYGEELRLISGGESGIWHVEIRNRADDWCDGVGLAEYKSRGQVRRLLEALGRNEGKGG